ncbi:MAG TPA: DUF4870 domain-containing protein [Anaerolineae bacterium]|jgi:uncharacterized membrane protein|nr:DUF4870 domain-containing protein [Anaerolineae bacterium]
MATEREGPDEARAVRREAQGPAPGGEDQLGRTSTGIDPRLAAFLSYFLSIFVSFLAGLIFFLIESENRFVRFHALQAMFFNAALIVISTALTILAVISIFIPVLGLLLVAFLGLVFVIAAFILWIVLMVKSYQGEYYKVPLIGDWADRLA